MSDYVLSCSSTADLNTEWMTRRNIPFACFHISIDGKDYLDDMGKTVQPEALFDRMLSGANVKTSQIAAGEYMDFFRNYLDQGLDILHVSISSGISGTYNSALLARDLLKEEYPDRKILLIDSLCASSGYGFFVDALADRRDQGASLDELYNWGIDRRMNVQHWFYTTDLRFFIRGGRISKTAGAIGQVLGVCPLLCVDKEGKLALMEKVRTKKRVLKRTVDIMEQMAEGGKDYSGKCFICHSDPKEAMKIKEAIRDHFPNLNGEPVVFPIGVTIGCHTGPGTIAVFFWGKER